MFQSVLHRICFAIRHTQRYIEITFAYLVYEQMTDIQTGPSYLITSTASNDDVSASAMLISLSQFTMIYNAIRASKKARNAAGDNPVFRLSSTTKA